MKKLLFLIPFIVFTTIAHAAPTQPKTGVWTVPETTKKGDTIELDALVYNSDAKTVTVSVLFATPSDDVATVILTLPAGSAKTATTEWTVPDGQTVVTASVVKAVDASQKIVPDMLGPIGTVTVGKPAATPFSFGNFNISSNSWFGIAYNTIDPWRIKQAEKYAALRDNTRKDLKLDTPNDILSRYSIPNGPDVPGQIKQVPQPAPSFPIGKYATMFFATAMATIFGSAAIFYIAIACILLLLLRLFIRLFT